MQLAHAAVQTLSAATKEDPHNLDTIDAGLTSSLQAARELRAQLDGGGPVTPERLIAFEALFRATVAMQPILVGAEIDRAVEAVDESRAPDIGRISELRARYFTVAKSLLEGLKSGYQLAFEPKEKPWRFA